MTLFALTGVLTTLLNTIFYAFNLLVIKFVIVFSFTVIMPILGGSSGKSHLSQWDSNVFFPEWESFKFL